MRNNITDTVISLWTSALDLPKITKRKKLTVETHGSRKVMVVRTIYDAHIPPANEETRQSLLKSQSTGRLRDVPTSTRGREITTMRLSRSETSLHRMALQRGTSKEMFSSRRIGHSKLETDSLNKHANDRQFKQLDIVSELLPATENNATLNNAVSAVSPSLEIPFLDPNFDIEDILREAETEVEMGNLSETSVSTSSSPEMWEEAPRSCSSASSNSTLRSGFDKEISSSETKPLTTPSGPERRKADRPPERTSPEPKTKPVTFSQETRRRKEQYLKQKPLPAIPMTLSIVTNQNAKHIAALASRYSPSRSESPIDRFLVLKETDKTLSQAANDLERELEKTADVHPARRSEQSISEHTTVENAVDSLNVSPKREGSVTKALRTHQKESVATRKQHQTYRVFPPPGKSNPTKKNNIVQQNQSITESSAGGIKQHIQTSQSSRSVSHKIKSSVQLPGLRRTRLNNQTAHPTRHQQNKPPTLSTKSPIESLRDEQAALAKSTDRYIDAEIAKALNVEYDEEEEDDDSIDSKDIEGEWSTMYPLKAVKKLGIPLLTNSHIPRLSSSETERSLLQQQSPKLDTKSIQILSPLSPPDDISMRVRSFIADSAFFQSPTEEKQLISTDEKLGSDKVFICLGRMETVPEDTPLKTDKVPLMMGIRTAPQPLAATYPPRNQSLCELDGTTQLLSPNPLKMLHQMPDDVVLALMWNVDNLDGLFKYAQVNRQFYRVFKDNELPLIKNALFKMNPPAWELREMSPPWSDISNGLKDPDAPVPGYNASSYLQHYARDVFAIVRLKALIYATCSTIVRSDTIGGLTGEDDVRASEIDEAFWRVWTFCRIFGCGKNREGDIHGQIDWLNGGYLAKRSKSGATVITAEPFFSMNNVLFDPPAGFGDGNGDGLTCNQLYDMLEIWNCLGTLVQGFHRECKEARVAGIFDGLDIPVGDITKEEAMLEEWTHYLLTLGPSALVSLSSVTASYSAEEVFAKANQMGLTKWEAPEDGGTRSSFLREAISRAYDSRVTIQQKLSNFPVSHNEGSVHSVAAGSDGTRDLSHNTTSNSQPGHSLWTDGDDPSSHRSPPYTSVNHDNTFTTPLLSPPPRYSVTDSNFIDPVDRAIHRMVHELGFSERDATWALKITDTGDMLDINAAIQLLVRERRKRARFKLFYNPACSMASGRDECLVDVSRHRGTVGWRWA